MEAIREAQLAVTGTHDEDHEKVLALYKRQLAHSLPSWNSKSNAHTATSASSAV